MSSPKRFRIRYERSKRLRTVVEAPTHTDAATVVSRTLFGRQYALRMSAWNGRDGVFATIDDQTGEERERFFVEAEDGTGRIKQAPFSPPSLTFEDAKRLKQKR